MEKEVQEKICVKTLVYFLIRINADVCVSHSSKFYV